MQTKYKLVGNSAIYRLTPLPKVLDVPQRWVVDYRHVSDKGWVTSHAEQDDFSRFELVGVEEARAVFPQFFLQPVDGLELLGGDVVRVSHASFPPHEAVIEEFWNEDDVQVRSLSGHGVGFFKLSQLKFVRRPTA